jgi:hypothetical protein
MKLINFFGNMRKKRNYAEQFYVAPHKAQKDKLELLGGGVLCLAYLCTLLFLIQVLYMVEGEPNHQQVMQWILVELVSRHWNSSKGNNTL